MVCDMSTRQGVPTAVPVQQALYRTGFCQVGNHDLCPGVVAGVDCCCQQCHRPPHPDPCTPWCPDAENAYRQALVAAHTVEQAQAQLTSWAAVRAALVELLGVWRDVTVCPHIDAFDAAAEVESILERLAPEPEDEADDVV